MLALLATVGIMSAMSQEAHLIRNEIANQKVTQVGNREFVEGTLEGVPVVFSLAGVGKVSAAATATLMISQFGVDQIVFTGVAGGGHGVKIGDVVIGADYLQHDLDLSPMFRQYEIYSLGKQVLSAPPHLVDQMTRAAERYFASGITFPDLGIENPQVYIGTIISGDRFVCTSQDHSAIAHNLRTVLQKEFHAVEMEGAAVGQVCEELNVPYVVVRAISDQADQGAPVDFLAFIDQVAGQYSLGIIKEYLQEHATIRPPAQ